MKKIEPIDLNISILSIIVILSIIIILVEVIFYER